MFLSHATRTPPMVPGTCTGTGITRYWRATVYYNNLFQPTCWAPCLQHVLMNSARARLLINCATPSSENNCWQQVFSTFWKFHCKMKPVTAQLRNWCDHWLHIMNPLYKCIRPRVEDWRYLLPLWHWIQGRANLIVLVVYLVFDQNEKIGTQAWILITEPCRSIPLSQYLTLTRVDLKACICMKQIGFTNSGTLKEPKNQPSIDFQDTLTHWVAKTACRAQPGPSEGHRL
jgi:hypothetical protein